jgi:hypothetical protein
MTLIGAEPELSGASAGRVRPSDRALDALDDATGRSPASPGRSRLRTGGGLLSALARAEAPEDVVRMVLERSSLLARAGRELPAEAQSLLQRIVREADPATSPSDRADRAAPHRLETRTLNRFREVTRKVVTPSPAGRSLRNPAGPADAAGAEGNGASKVMKLAGKLMKLIHLAESERRLADAQRQVRMAENTADARADGAAGRGSEGTEDMTLNISALRQDVLDAVLRELELISWRREDPDGPSNWS